MVEAMLMRCREHVAIGLLVMACNSERAPSAAGEPSSSASQAAEVRASCDKAVALQKRLAPIDTKAVRAPVEAAISLPESKDGKPPPEGPVVNFRVRSFSVDGQLAETPADVRSLFDRRVEMAGQLGNAAPRAALLAIGRGDEDLARVGAVAEALGAEAEVYVLGSPPGTRAEQPPAALAREVATMDPSQRATALANAIRTSIQDCKPVGALFERLATEPADTRATTLKEKLPGAVGECDCKVHDDFADLAAYVLGGDRIIIAKRLVVSHEPSAKAISLKGLKGQALYDALPSGGASVRFEP